MAQDSLVRFSQAIVTQAENQRREYINKLEKERKEKVANKEQELKNWKDTFVTIQLGKLENEKMLAVSKRKNELKKELIEKRLEMFDELFEKVTENIEKYTETEQYKMSVKEELDKALETVGTDGTVCYALKRDFEMLKASKLGAKVQYAEANADIMGGFELLNADKKMFVDCTIKSSIERQKEKFYANSGLVIE